MSEPTYLPESDPVIEKVRQAIAPAVAELFGELPNGWRGSWCIRRARRCHTVLVIHLDQCPPREQMRSGKNARTKHVYLDAWQTEEPWILELVASKAIGALRASEWREVGLYSQDPPEPPITESVLSWQGAEAESANQKD